MLRLLAIAVIALVTISSTPAFARGKGGGKGAGKKASTHHGKTPRHR